MAAAIDLSGGADESTRAFYPRCLLCCTAACLLYGMRALELMRAIELMGQKVYRSVRQRHWGKVGHRDLPPAESHPPLARLRHHRGGGARLRPGHLPPPRRRDAPQLLRQCRLPWPAPRLRRCLAPDALPKHRRDELDGGRRDVGWMEAARRIRLE